MKEQYINNESDDEEVNTSFTFYNSSHEFKSVSLLNSLQIFYIIT